MPNLERMVSSAETGRASIRLEFNFGVDVSDVLIRVNNALSQVPAYSENVDEPRLSTNSFSENAFMYCRLIARDGNPLGLDVNLMQDFAEDHIRPRMERIAGVSRVDVSGGAARQVRIEVGAGRLAERGLFYAGGQRTLNLRVLREPGSNVIAIKRAMTVAAEELNESRLASIGLVLRLTNDDVRYVEDFVRNVFQNLLMGPLLATIVMYPFLRSWRATVVGVVGIPICTLAAFPGLLLAGRTIKVISLAGIAFAIGMTVDNTIVVLENIDRARRSGMAHPQATLIGVREVWPAVLASTLTTVLVLVPILFIDEEAGQLFSDVAIAISAAILASMLAAQARCVMGACRGRRC